MTLISEFQLGFLVGYLLGNVIAVVACFGMYAIVSRGGR